MIESCVKAPIYWKHPVIRSLNCMIMGQSELSIIPHFTYSHNNSSLND